MNGYVAFYGDKQHEVHADTSYEAQLAAIEHFKPPKSKRHLVSVGLVEIDGQPYLHTAVD